MDAKHTSPVLVVSIDGVAPRFVTPATMPRLSELARAGASCYRARTVVPSITVPAHASMFRGVDPVVHGLVDNAGRLGPDSAQQWPSFLAAARDSGLRTAALLNWAPLDALVEPTALDVRWFLNGGYGDDDDAIIAQAAPGVFGTSPDVAFAYLVAPDNAGHAHGWGSAAYIDALGTADDALGSLLDAWGERGSVIVTTDHGGHGDDHCSSQELDLITFVVARSPRLEPMSLWESASVLDVAPTVADLAGFPAPAAWSGSSLIGAQVPIVDHLCSLVEAMGDHCYGESVTMADHSLQAAALAAGQGGNDEMIVAALLHDVGHLLGPAGEWGLADHAGPGAEYLQHWLPATVVEPIRAHVDAKRYLVATDLTYADRLSRASVQTLALQGGPFSAAEADAFAADPWCSGAVSLRRIDDDAKVPNQTVPGIEEYRPLLARLVSDPVPSPRWLRDACVCAECRHPTNGQHLIDVTDLDGWHVRGRRGETSFDLAGPDGARHLVQLAPAAADAKVDTGLARSVPTLSPVRHDGRGDLTEFVDDLDRTGLALADGLGSVPGTVLEFAAGLGFVRNTNYGDLFDVIAKPDPNNMAYTTSGLALHTDNPYRDPIPSVQLLHCLEPAPSGGSSVFADGIAAAREFRAIDPDGFRMLTMTPLRFRFRDDQVDLSTTRTMIALDPTGEPSTVAVNHRSMLTPAPGPAAERFYRAYRSFVEVLDRFQVHIDLTAGELVAIDNRRVLHARTGFDPRHHRHLQGCYIDR